MFQFALKMPVETASFRNAPPCRGAAEGPHETGTIPFRYSVPMRILWVGLVAAALASAQEPASVFQNVCGKCHPPAAVVTPRPKAQWEETINKMVDLGAKMTPEER